MKNVHGLRVIFFRFADDVAVIAKSEEELTTFLTLIKFALSTEYRLLDGQRWEL